MLSCVPHLPQEAPLALSVLCRSRSRQGTVCAPHKLQDRGSSSPLPSQPASPRDLCLLLSPACLCSYSCCYKYCPSPISASKVKPEEFMSTGKSLRADVSPVAGNCGKSVLHFLVCKCLSLHSLILTLFHVNSVYF